MGKSNLSKGLYIYDDYSIGGWRFLKICHVFAGSIVFEQLIYGSFLHAVVVGVKKLVIFCGCHKWMTPNLSGWMNLAVKQDPRDHDPGHPRTQNKELFSF